MHYHSSIVNLDWQEYQKALEDADEKVQLANQIYELVNMFVCWPFCLLCWYVISCLYDSKTQ